MKRFIILCIVLSSLNGNAQQLPNGFSYLLEIDPTIKKELRYYTTNNKSPAPSSPTAEIRYPRPNVERIRRRRQRPSGSRGESQSRRH